MINKVAAYMTELKIASLEREDKVEVMAQAEELDIPSATKKLEDGQAEVQDPLEKINLGKGNQHRPTYVSKTLPLEYKTKLIGLLEEFSDCFAWEYHELLGLDSRVVEHRLPIKHYQPYKQPP